MPTSPETTPEVVGGVEEPDVPAVVDPSTDFDEYSARDEIYKKSDAARFALDQEKEGGEEPANEPDAEVVDKKKDDAGSENPEVVVLTKEEFLERFGKYRIKGKAAGEEVEAPVGDWVKATGLERHLTKRMQDLSLREKELYDRQGAPHVVPDAYSHQPVPDVPAGEKPLRYLSEDEVRARYNELSARSPYDANRFLQAANHEIETARQETEAVRKETATADFFAVYQDVTDEAWADMNSDEFIARHPDVVRLRERGDYYGVLDRAYTYYRADQLTKREREIEDRLSAQDAENRKRAAAKKAGQIVRSTTRPEPPPKDEGPKFESTLDHIRRRQEEARARMNVGGNLK